MSNQLVYESNSSRVLIRKNEELGTHIVKILNDEFPEPKLVKQFFNEFEILEGLDIPGVRKVLKWGKTKNRYTLFFQYKEGLTLKEYLRTPAPLEDKLRVAISVTQILADIHKENIIHKDIAPGNILINPEDLSVSLIDFGISSKFNLKNQNLGNPEKLEGTLTYISPEQTGRMNRAVDYRTDLYSLGVVLYELFGSKPPFDETDAISMVHSHIALKPKALHTLNEKIPKPISKIISKLLRKNAEDRYQSAQGLTQDLENCLRQWQRSREIENFEIAQNDFSGKFQLVEKLYGRDDELHRLLAGFERISQETCELILVAGYSGTGKSSLVHEIHKPITQKRGYFIEGKFDQFQKAVPYFAILQAFRNFVSVLLTENERKLKYFKDRIKTALKTEGKVLTDVMPDLELIIGTQPELAEVGGAEAQNRFNYVFRKFVHAVSPKQHPLVLFVDDLQWADSASLELLYALLTDPESTNFLCIGAYRDNEVSPSHPFMVTLKNMMNEGVKIETITLDNLKPEDVNGLISDSLNMDPLLTRGLSDLVMDKTGGNAFFVTQFLKALYENQLLYYDHDHHIWKWEINQIKAQNLPDDIVTLMSGKIRRMEQDTQDVLKYAASIGSSFDLKTLSVIAQKTEDDCVKTLYKALAEGLVVSMDLNYKFAHDRIQQAVYSLIPEDQRGKLHLQIGRLLLEQIPENQQEERLFDIVNHLNSGIPYIETNEEKGILTGLNLKAGIKAKEASAFEPASDYIDKGIELLEENHWSSQYEASVQLFTEAAETSFLCSRFDEMNSHIDTILQKAQGLDEKIKPYEIRINALKAENKLSEALSTGIELLEQLGEKMPKKPNTLKVLPDLLKTFWMLRGKSNEDIVNLPVNSNPYKTAAIRVCANTAPSSYWGYPEMFPFLIFRMVQLSLKYGNTAISAFGYATFGVIMVGVLNKIKLGYRYGKLGLDILNKFNAKEWLAQVYTPVYALINIWVDHIKNTQKPLQDSYHIGLETGAIEFACINANLYCIQAFLMGKKLDSIEEEIHDYSQSILSYKQDTNHSYNEVFRQAALNFMGESDDPTLLIGGAFDEKAEIEKAKETNNRTILFLIYLNKLILNLFFGQYEKAWENAVLGRPLLDAVLAKLEVGYFHYYEGLAAAGMMRQAPKYQQKKYRKRLKSDLKKVKFWASHAPSNYLHKYQTLQAEYYSSNGNYAQAKGFYDKAIINAEENEFLHEEALAFELAGKLNVETDHANLASYYLKNAFQVYRDWGATAKIKDLQKNYPDLVSGLGVRRRKSHGFRKTGGFEVGTTTTTVSDESILDMSSVLKASSSISSEIVLDKLIINLLKILSENLGATTAFLLLEQEGELLVKAKAKPSENIEEIVDLNLHEVDNIPKSLISFVQRTRDEQVIGDAKEDKRYSQDPYFKSANILSAFAYPVIHKNELTGILYFENDLAEEAFTEERIEILSLLSGQIAVSIENAMLYDSLEQKVVERTAQLNEEKKKSDTLLLNILPESTAEELKQFGKAKPRYFEDVTVLFTDFKDFTRISETMGAEELVNEIDTYFAEFDRIIERNHLEKIKTIGDAYMAASGLPKPNDEHVLNAVKASIEIRDYMLEMKAKREESGRPAFGIRVGLNTGPVVAGVVGLHKFAFDIWGDTVNTAARMESKCDPWKINISGSSYERIKDFYTCTYRGKIEAKNKGKIDMYYIDAPIN